VLFLIRPAIAADGPAVWSIIAPVISAGETYALEPTLSRDEALSYWMGADRSTFVAEEGGDVVGTYYLKPNQAGGGAHVANCGYTTAASAMGRGVARALCAHSLDEARRRGFLSMQFNFVVATNERAVRLWRSMGFDVVGRSPRAFRLPDGRLSDALIMHRDL
jgi:ribosomal protein S18 acetylase RimI-like enzyme